MGTNSQEKIYTCGEESVTVEYVEEMLVGEDMENMGNKRQSKRSPRESTFAKRVWKTLKTIPHSYFFTVQQVSIRGIPDIVGVVNGLFVALELKRDSKEAAKKTGRIALQKYVGAQIEKSGGLFWLVTPDNFESIATMLRNYSTEHLFTDEC